MKRNALVIGTAACLAATMMACPIETPPPPFDTSGTYGGTWSGNSTDQAQNVQECALSMSLSQNVNADFPQDHAVNGNITVDYSCIQLPDWVQDQPVPSNVQVSGILADDGTFSLLSGGCGTGLCVVLGLSGTGVDEDADGVMDSYSGTWSYRILLAGVEPFGFDGTFNVAAAAE